MQMLMERPCGMQQFARVAYVIGIALAVALGLGAAYVVGVIGSTPEEEQQAQTVTGTDNTDGTSDTTTGDVAAE